MPFGDGTGPRGMGPMTGRGAGYCTGFDRPGFANSIPGRGFGRSFGVGMVFGFRGASPPWPYVGRGRGGLPRCGYFFSGAKVPATRPYPQTPFYGVPPAYGYAPPAGSMGKDEELKYMKDQAEAIKGQLEEIEFRMRKLEAED